MICSMQQFCCDYFCQDCNKYHALRKEFPLIRQILFNTRLFLIFFSFLVSGHQLITLKNGGSGSNYLDELPANLIV